MTEKRIDGLVGSCRPLREMLENDTDAGRCESAWQARHAFACPGTGVPFDSVSVTAGLTARSVWMLTRLSLASLWQALQVRMVKSMRGFLNIESDAIVVVWHVSQATKWGELVA